MIRAGGLALALGCAAWPGAVGASFRPLLDHPYRYDTDETRTAGSVVRRFHARRTVVFTRTATGYDAVVTLDAMDQAAGGAIGALFDAAADALRGYALRFHIDPTGRITGVDDADAAIARIVAALDRVDPARSGHAAAAAPLLAAGPERAAILLSILRPMIAAADAERPAGTRAVTLPAPAPLPGAARLVGTQTIAHPDPATVTTDMRAQSGPDPVLPDLYPGVDPPGSATLSLHAARRIDAATGLLIEGRETKVATLPGAGGTLRATTETVIHVAF